MTYASEVLTDTPLAYWPLDEASGTFGDDSANGKTVIWGVGGGLTDGTYGNVGPVTGQTAAGLNGTTNRLESDLSLNHSDITLEVWYKGTDTSGVLASGRGAERSITLLMGYGPLGGVSSGQVAFGISGTSLWQGIGTAATINDGQWHHVVGVFDGASGATIATGQFKIYIDGIAVPTGVLPGTGGPPAAPLLTSIYTFGHNASDSGAGFLAGDLGQIAIYGTALTQARVQTHYTASGRSLPTRPDETPTGSLSSTIDGLAPLVYYRLGEAAGGTAYDVGGGQRDGFYVGTHTKGVTSITPSEPANTAVDFATGRVDISDSAWMDIDYLTVFARIKTDTIAGSDTIACNDFNGSAGDIAWRFRLNTGKLEGLFRHGGALVTLLGTTTLTVGQNYSVGMTWDGTNAKLYLNGAVDASSAPGGGVLNKPSTGYHIGALGEGSEPFDGVIDEVAIWGSALSGSDMSTLHSAAILPTGVTGYAAEVMLDTPLAYYRMGEASGTTLTDSSGNARHGTYSGSLALATTGLLTGDADTSVDFTGGHATVADAAWMQPANLTVEAWVNADTITGDRPIVTHTSWSGVPGATSRGFHLAIIGSRVNVGMRFTDSTSHDAVVGPTLVTGTRYHMVLTWDGTTIRLFINGVIVWATAAYAGKTMGDPVTSLRIGASTLDGDGAFAAFDGRIDEVALYGTALSPTRVATHYTSGSGAASPYSGYALKVLDDKPLVYWKFDETSGTVAEDAAGFSRTGTHFNGAAPGSTSLLTGDSAGKAVDFLAGSSQSVYRNHEAWMNTAHGTVEGWFRADGAPGSNGVHTLAAKDDNAASFSSRAWQLNMADATGIVTWMAFYSGSTRFIVDSPAAAMPRDTTLHVVGTYDGVTARLYINGVQVASVAAAGALETSGYALQIGKESSGNTRGMTGQADEFAYYGVALSAARILAHYNAGVATPAPSGNYGTASAESDAAGVATVAAPAVVNGTGSAFGVSNATTSSGAALAIVTSGEISNREGGRWRQAIGYATWMPAVEPAMDSLVISKDVAFAYSTPVVDNTNGNVAYVATKTETVRHRDRIVVGGKDITWWRGSATPLPGFALVEPLGYGPATLVLPQVAAAFEQPGIGVLKFLKAGASVVIQRVNDADEVVATDYKGVIIGFSADGPNLTCTVGGEASGRAALREKQVPIFFWRKDLGRYAHDAIKNLRLQFDPYLGPDTGIDVMRFGGMGYLEFLQQLCAMGTTRTGKQWTIMPDWTTGKYEMFRKDMTTIRGTVYNDDARTVASINRDLGEEPNRIYATGVTPEGLRVRFGRYPGLKQSPVPPYPYNDNRTFGQGTTDGMTDTGDSITILINRLYITKYLGREEIPLGYGAKATRAIKDLQRDAGLTVTGDINVKTWAALYDLTATGFSLRGSHIGPAAESRKVRPWNLSGSGAKMSRNPGYDRSVLPVDRNVDVGTGFERGQIKEWSETELEDGTATPNWVGTITFKTNALVSGTHTPGDPLEVVDILRARDLRAGDNLWLPLCQGGITVHVSAVQVSAGTGEVSVDVDTRGRDALEVWEVITRNREARKSLRREWLRENRSSTQTKDSTAPWDEVGGILYDKVNLVTNKWNVFPVVAGQEGQIQRLRLRTNPNAEFVMAVFGKRIYPARLRKLIGNPLTETGSKKWLKESVKDALDETNVLLYVAGSDKQPCGYFPKAKTGKNDENTGAAPLTGRWEDDSSFPYRCFPATVLWVAIWVDRDTTIPQGRIMWPQLEAGT